MKNLIPKLCFLIMLCSITAIGQNLEDPILLWPEGAPGATGNSDEDKPAIIPFIPDQSIRNGAAVLVIPGGGFTLRATDHEGVLVAQWFKKQGITAFLLRYRLKPLYTRNEWKMDGHRAMQFIRSHAKDYHISPNRIGAIGFSAGATLSADMSFNPISTNDDATDVLEPFSSKPDFLILAYGSEELPSDITPDMAAQLPPTFMFCTAEDMGHMTDMIALYDKLLEANVPAEAHFFGKGEHGVGFALGDPVLGEWPNLLHRWLLVNGFMTDQQLSAFSGIVKLDGTPLIRGMVILTPIENPNLPSKVIYITNTGTGPLGQFSIPSNQGLVAGKYKVEVRQDAKRWLSNSRNPVTIKMTAKQKEGKLTAEDLKIWGEALRNQDLSPSINNQIVYAKQHPDDMHDYVIEIKNNNDLIIEVFSK